MPLAIIASPSFARVAKKPHPKLWQAAETLALLGVGPHENFYRDLKR